MNKREVLFSLLDANRVTPYIPAAFFLHFDPEFHRGQAAVQKHLDYFHHTGMDFVKIQYEKSFPPLATIQKAKDWSQMPFYGIDFYAEPLAVVKGLVKEAKKDALIIVTLYSPFMCAGHTAGQEHINQHFQEDPEAVKKGMEIVTESLMIFVRACIDLGVDGFYHSTQGGEADRFQDKSIFEQYIKPYDLIVMNEINQHCAFNILHICDYVSGYDDLTPFLDYPGHIVNASLHLGEKQITPQHLADWFKRPFMGGMERKGIIAKGNKTEITAEVQALLELAPQIFVLGADCTVPSETPWDNLQAAILTAHQFRK